MGSGWSRDGGAGRISVGFDGLMKADREGAVIRSHGSGDGTIGEHETRRCKYRPLTRVSLQAVVAATTKIIDQIKRFRGSELELLHNLLVGLTAIDQVTNVAH